MATPRAVLQRRYGLLFGILLIGGTVWVAFKQTPTSSLAPTPRSVWQDLAQVVSQPLAALSTAATTTPVKAGEAVPILMYHHIQDPDPATASALDVGLSVSPTLFREELQYLRQKGYTAISLATFRSGSYPAKSVILSFDDGYEDFYRNAWPILRDNGLTGTLYAITGKLDKPGFLTTEQLRTLARAGIEIGSHTVTHANLTHVSPANLTKELRDSRKTLQQITGQPVTAFCYPSGQFDASVEQAVAQAGYTTATTTETGTALPAKWYELPRWRVRHNEAPETFAANLAVKPSPAKGATQTTPVIKP